MRVRAFELRLLAVILTALWVASGLIVLVAYRPGGPVDLLVGIAASLPLPVSLVAVIWPPVVRTGRAMAGVVWLGVIAVLLLIPSIGGVTFQVLDRTSQPLLPSLEVVYPWFLALMATGLFAGLGLTRAVTGDLSLGRKRLAASAGFAVLTTFVIATAFAGVSLANDAALRDKPAEHSRFGPTAAVPAPPACNGTLKLGSTAQLDMNLNVRVDQTAAGDVGITGVRSGDDVSWTAEVVKPDLVGRYAVVRDGGSGWVLESGSAWREVAPASLSSELLDSTVFSTILAEGNRVTAEELGLEFVEGARARRCRVSVDGRLFAAAFPQIRYLIGDANIAKWRGQIDYWIFGDAEVGKISGTVNGDAADILPHGLQATAQVMLTAVNRGAAVQIGPPH